MTERRSEKNGGTMSKPLKPADGARSSNNAARETEADEAGGDDSSRVSRRKALTIGAATAASTALPIEAMARTIAGQTAAPLLLERVKGALEAAHELRDIRAELAACQAKILRMDPHSAASRSEQSRQFSLAYLQGEAETRAFSTANGISSKASAALKADMRELEIVLTRYIFQGAVTPVTPDWDAWARKREVVWRRWLADRATRLTAG